MICSKLILVWNCVSMFAFVTYIIIRATFNVKRWRRCIPLTFAATIISSLFNNDNLFENDKDEMMLANVANVKWNASCKYSRFPCNLFHSRIFSLKIYFILFFFIEDSPKHLSIQILRVDTSRSIRVKANRKELIRCLKRNWRTKFPSHCCWIKIASNVWMSF